MTDLSPAPARLGADDEHLPEHYIETQTSLVERALRNLKHGETFAVLDSYGDIGTVGSTPEGLFYRDTRYLSLLEIDLEGTRPLLLGSVIRDDNATLWVDLTNADIGRDGDISLPREKIALGRTKFLYDGTCYDRIGLRNFDDRARAFRLSVRFDADFRDLFEVRGTPRPKRGRMGARVLDAARVEYVYHGLDELTRVTTLAFEPAPRILETGRAVFDISLPAQARGSVSVTISCREHGCDDGKGDVARPFVPAFRAARREEKAATREIATVESSNLIFNEVACRSTSDIYMLLTQTPEGAYPAAGIPWYSTVFGRDGIITAMMMLWVDPKIARGVLRHLAANQARELDPAADAQPGKILHECRYSEMANLGEVPFRRYYGTVDATPLFVMLAGQYLERTGDAETVKDLWPSIEAALHWCDRYGDRDGDGFVEYFRETEQGLANQGWKDSHDSIFHADGSSAPGSIALCEVQGYVYAAKKAGAAIAVVAGHLRIAARLMREAEELKARFHQAFWSDRIGTYGLALDGDKRLCEVRASNAGHALFAGIADEAHAAKIAATLLGPEGFGGWGVRTIAQGEPRYNPMSYHNGSVWPHDNTLIAMGLARYGLKREAALVFDAIFDAARSQELRRLPELYCGFIRRRHRGPTSYPVACSPQAWAAASPFGLLAACIGLDLRASEDQICLTDPQLPSFLDDVVIRGLRIPGSRADLKLQRIGDDVSVTVLSRQGSARITQSR